MEIFSYELMKSYPILFNYSLIVQNMGFYKLLIQTQLMNIYIIFHINLL